MTKFLPVLLYLSVVSYVTSKPTLLVKDVGCNDRDTDTKCYYCSSHYDRPELYEQCCNDVAFQDHCKTEIWVELKRESMW